MPDFVGEENVSLAAHTTLALGGAARLWVTASEDKTILDALRWAEEKGHRAAVLGGGSNLVVSDAGFDGLVIKIATAGTKWHEDGDDHVLATVQAGENWDCFVDTAVARNLTGIECLSGIPGLVGATPIQNVGAYGQSVADTIDHVMVLDRTTLDVTRWAAADCGFSYRNSRFKEQPGQYVVLSVCFRLVKNGTPTLCYRELEDAHAGKTPTAASVRDTVIRLRRSKSMVLDEADPNRRSAGSFFTNPIVSAAQAEEVLRRATREGWLNDRGDIPRFPQPNGDVKLAAGWLIERAGFPKGSRSGAVGQSSKHALALVHHGGGTTAELLAYAASIRDAVQNTFGVVLEQEPRLWA